MWQTDGGANSTWWLISCRIWDNEQPAHGQIALLSMRPLGGNQHSIPSVLTALAIRPCCVMTWLSLGGILRVMRCDISGRGRYLIKGHFMNAIFDKGIFRSCNRTELKSFRFFYEMLDILEYYVTLLFAKLQAYKVVVLLLAICRWSGFIFWYWIRSPSTSWYVVTLLQKMAHDS